MDIAAVKILLLFQGDLSLEAHLQRYLDLVSVVHYDDYSLCVLFRVGFESSSCAHLPREGNFKKYVDWVLLQCRSPCNIGESEERNSAPAAATSSATDQPEPTA